MKCVYFFLAFCTFLGTSLSAQQRYFTKTGTIVFDADGPLDDIEKIHANNTDASCVIDAETGQMEWAVSIKQFKFENALMEEHFNENYLESSKFPKAIFKGTLANSDVVKWNQEGTYQVRVEGKLTLHGVTKNVTTTGTIAVKNKQISANAALLIGLADYDIKVPSVVGFKIAKEAKVSIQAILQPLK